MGAIADKQGKVNYSFRRAYETNAFRQFPLIGISKKQLAERMAVLILDDLRERGVEVVSAERPIVSMLIAVFRVT